MFPKRGQQTVIRGIFSLALFCSASAALGQLRAIEQAKKDTAKVQIVTLRAAVDAYFVNHGKYPASLDDLLKGDPPILKDRKSLIDPWGHPYRYDPLKEPPRIWTE